MKAKENSLIEKVGDMQSRALQNSPPQRKSAEIFQLEPHLKRGQVALPNDLVRSALFTANNRNVPRRRMDDEIVFTQGNDTMVFSGEELRTDDEELWMHLVRMFDGLPYGTALERSTGELLDALGRSKGQSSYQWLEAAMWRLKKAAVKIDRGGRQIMVSLIDYAQLEDSLDGRSKRGSWRIRLSQEAMSLFTGKRITKVSLEQRSKLSSGVETKIYQYYISHKRPYGIKISTFFGLCFNREANTAAELRRFRNRVKKALTRLVEIHVLDDFEVSHNGLVTVVRTDTAQTPLLD